MLILGGVWWLRDFNQRAKVQSANRALDSAESETTWWAGRPPRNPGDSHRISDLLARGAEISHVTWNGDHVLMLAAAWGDLAAIRQAVNGGIPVDAPSPKYPENTALFTAAYFGQAEAARLLISLGANPNPATQNPPPLRMAVAMGHLATVRVLLDHGAPADPKLWHGQSLLHDAITGRGGRKEFEDVAELLIARGTRRNHVDLQGQTPLDLARAGRNDRFAALLKRHGALTAQQVKAARKSGIKTRP